jgi:hypothetical protein
MTQGPFFTTLKDRGLIKISGPDRYVFLQNLITNDIGLLNKQDALYACLLSPKGMFLYDFFISEPEHEVETLYIECEGGKRAKNLANKLDCYKQDSKINIETKPNIPFFAVLGLAFGYKDPRHDKMGYRAYRRPAGIPEEHFEKWDYLRISLGIPDGSRDMIYGKTTMAAARIARFNGLSYEKSDYIGQNFVAQRHYSGLIKKHLQHVKLSDMPEGAELRSSCKDLGIALITHAAAPISPIKQKH